MSKKKIKTSGLGDLLENVKSTFMKLKTFLGVISIMAIPNLFTSCGDNDELIPSNSYKRKYDYFDGMVYYKKLPISMSAEVVGAETSNNVIVIADTIYIEGSVYPVTSISNQAFAGNNIPSINIPKTIKSIGEGAFQFCEKLQEVNLPTGIEDICSGAFQGCKKLPSIVIPNSVTHIGSFAFQDCSNLSSVVISNNIDKIEEYTFSRCTTLTSIAVPNSVKDIALRAFQDCHSLLSVSLSENLISIGGYAFSGCRNLPSITIPQKCESIGEYAFNYCKRLEEVNVSGNPYFIGKESFNGTAWYEAQPDGVVYVGNVAYKYKGLSVEFISNPKNKISVTFKDGTIGITDEAFKGFQCIIGAYFPESLLTIGKYAFSGCLQLRQITIPDNVTTIGDYAFYNCADLKENEKTKKMEIVGKLYLGQKLTSIGHHAFENCLLLSVNSNIEYPASCKVGVECFSMCDKIELYFPYSKLKTPTDPVDPSDPETILYYRYLGYYLSTNPWNEFKNMKSK